MSDNLPGIGVRKFSFQPEQQKKILGKQYWWFQIPACTFSNSYKCDLHWQNNIGDTFDLLFQLLMTDAKIWEFTSVLGSIWWKNGTWDALSLSLSLPLSPKKREVCLINWHDTWYLADVWSPYFFYHFYHWIRCKFSSRIFYSTHIRKT
jgi:hypothetical protein